MKKVLTLVAVLVLVIVATLALTACDKESAITITGYDIAESKFNIGDTFAAPTITATLSDETTKTVTNNIVYNEDDLNALKLDDDNKFTESGSYEVKVYILEDRGDTDLPYYIGKWKITVRVNKS